MCEAESPEKVQSPSGETGLGTLRLGRGAASVPAAAGVLSLRVSAGVPRTGRRCWEVLLAGGLIGPTSWGLSLSFRRNQPLEGKLGSNKVSPRLQDNPERWTEGTKSVPQGSRSHSASL